MVCSRCFTFNHAPYITDAMNGFTMQETTFPVVTVIVDDASTDGEQNVIRKYLDEHFQKPYRTEETEYAHIVCANHRINPNCQFVVFLLKYNHFSIKKDKFLYINEWLDNAKYHALCEGDDYWTDQEKLQKQVSFLEMHPEFNVCSHDYVVYSNNEKKIVEESVYSTFFKNEAILLPFLEYSLKDYFKAGYIRTLTCVYRNGSYLNNIPREKYKHYRDDIFHYYLLKQGKGVLLKDVMGVYRIHDGGVWSAIRGTGRDIEATIYNAYNIFTVENDKKAFNKIKKLYVNLIILQLHEGMYCHTLGSIKKCFYQLPLKDFVFVIFQTLNTIIRTTIKKLFHR